MSFQFSLAEGGRALCAVVCPVCFPVAPHGHGYRGEGGVGQGESLCPGYSLTVSIR